jgi:hypothetical protein
MSPNATYPVPADIFREGNTLSSVRKEDASNRMEGGDKRKSLVLPEGGKINMCQNKNKRYLVLCQ